MSGSVAASSIQLQLGPYHGETTYQIGGRIDANDLSIPFHFPVSELRFPMDVIVAKVDVDMLIYEKINFKLSAIHNLNRNSGFLEDSDWLSSNSKNPDIFSKSDATVDLWEINVKSQYRLTKNYWTGIGLMASQRAFAASNVTQIYPNDPSKPPITKSGKVITYSHSQLTPFWEFGIDQPLKDKLSMQIEYGYSPYVWVSDRDDHLLRSKLATGSLIGQSYQWKFGLTYPLSENLSGNLSYVYQNMTATGRQSQSRYQDTSEGPKGPIAELDQRSLSEHWALTMGMTYQFKRATSNTPESDLMIQESSPKITPIIALDHRVPLNHWKAATGPLIELHSNRGTVGLGYFSGQNQVDVVSAGRYTSLPIYGIWNTPVSKWLTLELGGGYSINHNDIDIKASSRLDQLGYLNADEQISSSPFILIGVQVAAPKSQQKVSYGIRYSYQEPTITARSQSYRYQDKIKIAQIEAMIRVQY